MKFLSLLLLVLSFSASAQAPRAYELTVPAGMIAEFATTVCPTGWLKLDGNEYQKSLYPRLSAVIANHGGTATTFKVPDHRGMFARMIAETSGRDVDAASRVALNGGPAGNVVGSFQDEMYALHNHSQNPHRHRALGNSTVGGSVVNLGPTQAAQSFSGTNYASSLAYQDLGAGGSSYIENTTATNIGAGGSETRPKNIYVLKCVKI